MLAPVIKLSPLTNEEMLVLIEKLSNIHSVLLDYESTLNEKQLAEFIKIEYGRIGAEKNITPREVIRDFIELLNILYQNPDISIAELLGDDSFSFAVSAENLDDELIELEI